MLSTENYIPEEELPVRAGLTAIRNNDPYHGLSEEEIRDRLEFIRCFLFKDFEVLLLIPKKEKTNTFFINDLTPADPRYSAFNTVDFKRREFDKYGYAIRKIVEHIKELAIMHSCINDPVDRDAVRKRYENFLDIKFRDRLAVLIVQLQNTQDLNRKSPLQDNIAELKRRILEAGKIWARYAPPENWDR